MEKIFRVDNLISKASVEELGVPKMAALHHLKLVEYA